MYSKCVLAVLLFSCVAGRALGQAERITLFADAAGTDCSITDVAAGTVDVHMFHTGSGRRGASHFIAPKPPCWEGAVWIGDAIPLTFLYLGDTQTDFVVAYQNGVPCGTNELPLHIGMIRYLVAGTGQPCCEYPILPAPTAEIPGSVVTVDCDPPPFGEIIAIAAGKVTINETPNCLCDPPLSVETSTWGRVKALYR
jgi:hypothetical protein